MNTKTVLLAVLFSLVLLSGCISTEVQAQEEDAGVENETQPPVADEGGESELANPAAVNCENRGYDYELRETEGGVSGYCSYDGKECEEWALYRGECCLTSQDCSIECGGTVDCIESVCVCQEEEEEPAYETISKSTQELLDERLSGCNSWFYSENPSGDFTVTTYKWLRGEGENPPNLITIGAGDVENEVLFNGNAIERIVAISFKAYESSEDAVSCGSAIFRTESTVLDGYSDFSIDFQPSFAEAEIRRQMSDCEITEKANYLSGGEVLSVYGFRCRTVD